MKQIALALKDQQKLFKYLFLTVFGFLLLSRFFPYILHGPFGFGYDLGIYKKSFELIQSLADVSTSEIYLFPAFVAYVFNFLNIPLDILLYYGHIFLSVIIAFPLYLLTKEHFGKAAGLIAVTLFAFSYIQLFASEFYLFKAVMGSIFFLACYLTYQRRSYWFYLFLLLLGLTQLPQLLVVLVGVFFAAILDKRKKDFRFNFVGIVCLVLGAILAFWFSFDHLKNAFNVVISALQGVQSYDAHYAGLFMAPAAYLYRSWIILVLGVLGMLVTYGKKELLTLKASIVFLFFVVFLELFFQNRYTLELDLLLIPFAAYAISAFGKKFYEKSAVLRFWILSVALILAVLLSGWYFKTTYSALNEVEVWALEVIAERDDVEYVFVTDTTYAPWAYGFSEKEALAPGIFTSVWDFETWAQYHQAGVSKKVEMLIKVAEDYGDYYLFEGLKQPNLHFEEQSEKVQKIFDVNGVRVYKIAT